VLSQLESNAASLGMARLVLVLALITRGFKASPPEITATEKATVEVAARPCQFVVQRWVGNAISR
jgi:putrescine importer